VAIGTAGAANAGLLAAQILASNDSDLHAKLTQRRKAIEEKVLNLKL
ncbi:MAG: 5-(carboxyamino)imidazole ribonucleotide mutase, partial [Defluviitaleaceae bacterium]|nr:5-(carboxyamino)imidazole ribonucleotide mutase [Defluviitaleaceae bacterium]